MEEHIRFAKCENIQASYSLCERDGSFKGEREDYIVRNGRIWNPQHIVCDECATATSVAAPTGHL